MIYAFTFAALGGGFFWWRGSARFAEWIGRGKTTADAVFAFVMGIVATVAAAEPVWWLGGVVMLTFWIGLRPGWPDCLSLGRDITQGPFWLQLLLHTGRGVVFVAPPAVMLWWLGYHHVGPLLAVGVMCPVFYEIGWSLRETVPASIEFDEREGGDVLFGAFQALALAIVVA